MKKVIETYFLDGAPAPIYKLDSGQFLYPVIGNDKICRWKTKEDILKEPFISEDARIKFEKAFSIFEQ